jgi:hypothetical protein
MRLSNAGPTRFGFVPATAPNSGSEDDAREPWSEIPRALTAVFVGAEPPVALVELADQAGRIVEEDEADAPAGGVFDVKPGGRVFVRGGGLAIPDGGVTVPAGGVAVLDDGCAVDPEGCHAGFEDAGDAAPEGATGWPPIASPVDGGGTRVRPAKKGSVAGACPWLVQPVKSNPIKIGAR